MNFKKYSKDFQEYFNKLFDFSQNNYRYLLVLLIIFIIFFILLYLVNLNPYYNKVWYNVGTDSQVANNRREILNQNFRGFFNDKTDISREYQFTKKQYQSVNLQNIKNNEYIINNKGYYFLNKNRVSSLVYIVNAILICIFSFIFFLIYKYTRTKDSKDSNNGISYLTILLKSLMVLFKFFCIILLPVILIYLFIVYNTRYSSQIGFYKTVFIFIVILFTLAIIYSVFNKYIDKCYNISDKSIVKTIICSIIYIIFALPCLLVIITDEFKQQLNITPPVTYILLIAELILVLLFFFLSNFFKGVSINQDKYINGGETIDLYNEYKNFNKDFNKYLKHDNIVTQRNYNYNYNLGKDSNYVIPLTGGDYKYNINIENNFNKKVIFEDINKFNISFKLYIKADDYLEKNNIRFFNFFDMPMIYFNNKTKQLVFNIKDKKNNETYTYETSNFKLQTYNLIQVKYEDSRIDIYINNIVKYSTNIIFKFNHNNINNNYIGTDNILHGNIKDLYFKLSVK